MNLNEKKELVRQIKGKFESSQAFFFSRNLGLNASEIYSLRKDVKRANGEFKVVKNTLTRIIMKDLGYEGLEKDLNGPTTIAFSMGDPTLVAKTLVKVCKETSNRLQVTAGYLGRTLLTSADIDQLSSLPGKDELIAQAVYTIAAPLQNFLGVLSAVPRDFLNVLTAIKEKKQN